MKLTSTSLAGLLAGTLAANAAELRVSPQWSTADVRHQVAQIIADGMPLDRVARFHLGNGARVHKVHAQADLSGKGLRQSIGVIVSYLCDLSRVSQMHEPFASSHVVAASPEVRSLSQNAGKHLLQEAG